MKTLYFCTTSKKKLIQFREFFSSGGYSVEQLELDIPEIQCCDVSAVAGKKLEIASRLTDLRPLVVDDAGLEVADLNSFPGALLKPILEQGGLGLLAKLTSNASVHGRVNATLVSAVALHTGQGHFLSKGLLPGFLDFRDQERLTDRDTTRVFYPEGKDLPLQQLTMDVGESAFSHRFSAMSDIMRYLQSQAELAPS